MWLLNFVELGNSLKAYLYMWLLNCARDLAVAFGLASRNVWPGRMYRDAVNVIRVAGVMPLSVRLEVVEDDDGCNVVDDLARRQEVQVRIAVAVDLSRI